MPGSQVRALELLEFLSSKGFNVQFVSHAKAILLGEFLDSVSELCETLLTMELPISEIIGSGGGETKFTQRLRKSLSERGWTKHVFEIAKTVDGEPRESTSHEVDHVKRFPKVGVLALEIEWNNKDPFFDRDLENFKRLHAEGAISVGIIVTRGESLQNELKGCVARFADERAIKSIDDLAAHGVVPTPKQRANILRRVERAANPIAFAEAWTDNFVSNKFGQATTHWDKLQHRVKRGVGNPCPLLLIGLPSTMVVFDQAKVEQQSEDDLGAEPV